MALSPSTLKSQLETAWLVPPGGSYPENAQASADRFANAVASWLSLAQANGFPCTTAAARKSQLASLLAIAFQTGSASSAAQALANALTLYITGQQFGSGVAAPPTGASAAASAFSAIFSNRELPNPARAQLLADACQALALTTLVAFPPPLPTPAPLM